MTAAGWADDPERPGLLARLLPPALPGRPAILSARGGPAVHGAPEVAEFRRAIREERLFWPEPRHDAVPAPVVLDLSEAPAAAKLSALDAVLAAHDPAEVLVIASGRLARRAASRGARTAPDLAHADPDALAAVYAPFGAASPCWAALGGLRGGWAAAGGIATVDPTPWLLRATAVDPWRGDAVSVEEGLAALAFLHAEARRNARPRATVGMSRWKRRNIAPFLAGPHGPALHFRTAQAARRAVGGDGVLVHWGQAPDDGGLAERAEDGFIRSVGLGLRHTPPASLAIGPGGLHFEAAGENGFVRLARDADYSAELLTRARRLRETVIRRRITKYNLDAAAAPPDAAGRLRLLVPGQVEGDASLVHGSPGMRSNAALLEAARARHPDAFLLYKPHPDVLTGLRPGAVPPAILALADAVAPDASAEACLGWADKVETMTSLMGFEALMRGKAVATHGRPFYAGWGLTEDLSGLPPRGALDLDALVAAALILYPRYIDPVTRLPAPPEAAIDALSAERARAATPRLRLRALRRRLVSTFLNQIG